MAFPPVTEVLEQTTASGTSHVINLTSSGTLSAGELVLVFVRTTVTINSVPGSWGTLYDALSTNVRGAAYKFKAAGGETTATWGTSSAGVFRVFVVRIPAGSWCGVLDEVLAGSPFLGATSADPNPPNLDICPGVAGPAEDITWFVHAVTSSAASGITSYPANYSNGQEIDMVAFFARREFAADEDNPGVFDLTGTTNNSVANVVAVPSPIRFLDDFERTTGVHDWGNDWITEGSPTPYTVNGSEGELTAPDAEGLTHYLPVIDEFEVLALLRSDAGTEAMIAIGNGSSQGYGVRLFTWGANIYRMQQMANTYWNQSTVQEVSKTLTDSVDYWVRFQYVGGTLRAKIWAASGSEPGSWDHEEAPGSAYSNFNEVACISCSTGSLWYWGYIAVSSGSTIPLPAGATTGTATFSLGNVTVVSSGIQEISGTATININNVTITSAGNMKPVGTSVFTLPNIALISSGTQKIIASSAFNLPSLDLTATGEQVGDAIIGTAAFSLPNLLLEAAGEAPHVGTSVLLLPSVDLAASGAQKQIGTASIELPVIAVTSSGEQLLAGTSSFSLPAVVAQSSGGQLYLGTADIVLPSILLSAAGVQKTLGSSIIVLPSLELLSVAAVSGIGPGTPVSAILELFPYLASIEVGEYTLLVDLRKVLPGIAVRSL